MEQCGNMEIINHSTGHKANLTFKPAGVNSKDLHRVEGFISDRYRKPNVLIHIKSFRFFRRGKLLFIYGKWTEFIKSVEYRLYEDYMRDNGHRLKKDGESRSKSPNDSPANTPRKVLQKFNSLKVSPFKSNSTQEVIFHFYFFDSFYTPYFAEYGRTRTTRHVRRNRSQKRIHLLIGHPQFDHYLASQTETTTNRRSRAPKTTITNFPIVIDCGSSITSLRNSRCL